VELFSGMPEFLKIQNEISTLHQQINQIQGMAGNQKAEMHQGWLGMGELIFQMVYMLCLLDIKYSK
jgi:hypothetical protein